LEKEDEVEYSPDPYVRLVSIRNIWTKGDVGERVKNVKLMWGIFACNYYSRDLAWENRQNMTCVKV
jgi:hypothetical protein